MTLPNGAGLKTIVYGLNMYVATGYLYWGEEGIHGVAYTSKDGTTWK
ncbi:hypothetical protein J23TS9_54150 [Paenibacillus sp. J23TS9]|nr:hypothetical protein J23TS9_54150 [Paenibacillus sp. J23TS9]